MPPPVDPTATITFDYNNGTPIWSVDNDPLHVPQGTHNVIWQLDPQSTQGAELAANNGIAFDKGGTPWPGPVPTKNGRVYRSTVTNGSLTVQRCTYSVTVTYTPPGETSQDFKWDPDVELDPPPGTGRPPIKPPGQTGPPPHH